MTDNTEKLLFPPEVFSYNWPEGDPRHGKEGRNVPYALYEECKAKGPGHRVCCHAGAPGYGKVVYEITRVDETGAYGFVVENSIGILSPADVR